MKEIDFHTLQTNPAELIGKQWMLITAGTKDSFNFMTASWGGLGFIWNRPVAFVLVRPNRHTRRFIDEQESLTLTFLPEQYREALTYAGRHSGRDVDKVAATGLVPMLTPGGLVSFEDADLVLECRKLFVTQMQQQDFLHWSELTPRFYAEDNPLHRLYICEITGCHVRS